MAWYEWLYNPWKPISWVGAQGGSMGKMAGGGGGDRTATQDEFNEKYGNKAAGAMALAEQDKAYLSWLLGRGGSAPAGAQPFGTVNPTPSQGFRYGGQFQVMGRGGPDSQNVAFRATPGETVTVTPGPRPEDGARGNRQMPAPVHRPPILGGGLPGRMTPPPVAATPAAGPGPGPGGGPSPGPYVQATSVGQDPYGSDWRALVSQLQGQAAGTGPSLAAQQYQAASQDALGQQAALARGARGGPGMAAQAANNMQRIQQGLTQGVTQARTAEQMGAMTQLQGALGGAGNAAFQRSALNAQLAQQANMGNQEAFLNMLSQQTGLTRAQISALVAGQGQPGDMEKVMQVIATVGPLIAAA